MVADINGDAGCDPADLTAIGSTVYFSADNGTDGYQLWESNGTSKGTTMVDDINGKAGCNPANLTDVGGTLYFSAYTPTTGVQIWQTNGTCERHHDGHELQRLIGPCCVQLRGDERRSLFHGHGRLDVGADDLKKHLRECSRVSTKLWQGLLTLPPSGP